MEPQARKFDVSAFALRTIAIVCMLLDHIGLCLPKSKAGAKALQLGFYLFYPVHMLVLWFLFVK